MLRLRPARSRDGRQGRCHEPDLTSGLLGAYFDQHGPYAVLRGYDRTDRLGEGRDYQGKLSGSDSRPGTVRGRSAFCDKEGSERKTCPVMDCKSIGSKADREQPAGDPFLRTGDRGGKPSTHGSVPDRECPSCHYRPKAGVKARYGCDKERTYKDQMAWKI